MSRRMMPLLLCVVSFTLPVASDAGSFRDWALGKATNTEFDSFSADEQDPFELDSASTRLGPAGAMASREAHMHAAGSDRRAFARSLPTHLPGGETFERSLHGRPPDAATLPKSFIESLADSAYLAIDALASATPNRPLLGGGRIASLLSTSSGHARRAIGEIIFRVVGYIGGPSDRVPASGCWLE